MNPRETTKIEGITNQILHNTDFDGLSIEQKYAVLNRLRKSVDKMRDERNFKRVTDFEKSMSSRY